MNVIIWISIILNVCVGIYIFLGYILRGSMIDETERDGMKRDDFNQITIGSMIYSMINLSVCIYALNI